MANRQWRRRSILLALLLVCSAVAAEQEAALDEDFLEFLVEGKQVDGEYHDPLQMQDWNEKEVADAEQQQEEKDHE